MSLLLSLSLAGKRELMAAVGLSEQEERGNISIWWRRSRHFRLPLFQCAWLLFSAVSGSRLDAGELLPKRQLTWFDSTNERPLSRINALFINKLSSLCDEFKSAQCLGFGFINCGGLPKYMYYSLTIV